MIAGYTLVALAALMWGCIGPLSKFAFLAGMPPLEVAFWRTTMAWALYGAHAVHIGRTRVALADLPWLAGFGVAGIAGLFGSYVLAVEAGGAALASVLLYTAPAWVALMAWKLLKESMTPVKLIAVAITILGVAGVSLGQAQSGLGGPVNLAAIGFGLLSGFTYALYYIFGKVFLTRYPTPTLFLYALPVGALTLLPFFRFALHPVEGWLACVVLAVCCTYGAYMIYYAGLQRIEASRAAVIATLEPLVAALLAFSLFGERFTTLGYVGSGLILCAVLLTIFKR